MKKKAEEKYRMKEESKDAPEKMAETPTVPKNREGSDSHGNRAEKAAPPAPHGVS